MKILLVTDVHTPTGGAEKYFFDLKARLKTQPEIAVYSLGFGAKNEIGDDYIILKQHQSNLFKLLGRFFFHPLLFWRLRKWLRKINPDVIHLHNIKYYPATVLRAVKPYPVVQTMHDFSSICPTSQNTHRDLQICPTGIRRTCFWQHHVKFNTLLYLLMTISFYRINQLTKKVVKKYFAPSPMLVDYLQRNGFHDAICVLPFKPTLSATPIPTSSTKQFLYAGNLGKHKGVHLLLPEFAKAYQKDNSLRLKIAGRGPLAAWLKQQRKTYDIEPAVEIVEWTSNMSQLYHSSLAVLFPSIGCEAFGLVITEAMAHARPVIGVNRGTAAWLIEDGKTGLLFDPIKSGDLAEKMLALANDIALATTLGMNGQQKLQQLCDDDKTLEVILSAYRNVKKS